MNQKLIFRIVTIMFLTFLSCQSDDSVGKWDDNIELSEKEIDFTAESNTVVITTKGTYWWINGVGLNDDWNYDLTEIDTTKDTFLIEETEFSIERKSANEIEISMSENQSDSERILIISFQSGNYFDGIKITQSEN